MPESFKVSLYIRVSTDRQANEGDSLDEQEKELRRFCEFKQYAIHQVHIEPGRSAKDTKRPEYQKLMADIEAERIDAVVVKKLDRLSRSLLDFENFMTLAQKHNVEFISLKENFDTTNAMGKAMLRVALVFAQLEREQTSERVLDVCTYRAAQGFHNGGIIPYGYCSLNKELVPVKQEKRVIELMFEKFLETRSTTTVAQTLNAMGSRNRSGKLWDCRGIQHILRNMTYTGRIKWNGKVHKGIHQPIITIGRFDQVQEIFDSKNYISSRHQIKALLRGLSYCAYCGGKLSPNYTKKSNGEKYYYYRCVIRTNRSNGQPKCRGQFLPYDITNNLVITKILEYSTPKALAAMQANVTAHNKATEKEIELLKAENEQLTAKLETVQQKREKYLDSLMTGTFSNRDRRQINDKIDEYAITEKKLQADIYRQHFDLAAKKEQLVTIDPLKQALVQFKINHTQMTETEMSKWIRANVKKITLTGETVELEFKDMFANT